MKISFLFQTFLWCLLLTLSLQTFAQEKTRLDSGTLSAANNQNNSQSQSSITDATILRWDNGTNFDAIGLTSGGTFEVSARFPASLMGPLTGQGLTQMEIYINDLPNPCTLKIYDQGTATSPGALLYSENVTSQIVGLSFNLITLATPVTITGNDIWVGYEVTHAVGFYPAGCDPGPAQADGDWIYLAPGPWAKLSVIAPTLNYNWNIAAYVEPIGPPCPVTAPTNPSPADGTIDVAVSGNTLSWTNSTGTTQVEVWFGEAGNLAQVYSGSATTSFSLASLEPLNYFSDYGWKVMCKNDTCGTSGSTWTFTTMQDPNLQVLFCDDFESGTGNWTITNDGGTCVWLIYNPPYPNLYTLPPTSSAGVFAADVDECGSGTTLLSSARITTPLDATNYQNVWLEFDNDWNAIGASDFCYVDVSTDGGTTWQNVLTWGGTDVRNTHEVWDLTSMAALHTFTVRFKSVQPGWDWWWTVDNVCVYASDIVPVELTSFAATADYGVVELNWITSTETNNQGFEVQRSAIGDFETIAFIDGHGTTTESQVYTYSDRTVGIGLYSYRLKQVDFSGAYEYSNVVEVDVPAPNEFALEQNYPNPFNPSTKINFQLKVDSKVSLKVFDVLGQEVASLVNTNLVAGAHNVNFDASKLNSGVYLYRIEATGIDGSNFIDVKKMILTK